MSYTKPVIPVLEPKEGFNRLHKNYAKYHTHLTSFDKWAFTRLLPRVLKDLNVVDLWAGDGRLFKHFKDKWIARFVALDVAEDLLVRHPWIRWVEKIIADVEDKLPFDNDEFDLALSFFLFEYINDLRQLFEEVYRILKVWWTWVVWHYLHRREYTFKDKWGEFKIFHHRWRFEDIEEIAEWAFFKHSYIEIVENGQVQGRIYRFEKD